MNKKIFAYVSVTLLLLACQPTLTNTHPSLQSSSNMHPEQKNTPHLFNALSSQNKPQPSESTAFTDPDRKKLIPNLAKSEAVLPKRNLDLSSQKGKESYSVPHSEFVSTKKQTDTIFEPGLIVPEGRTAISPPPFATQKNTLPYDPKTNKRNMVTNKHLRLQFIAKTNFHQEKSTYQKTLFA